MKKKVFSLMMMLLLAFVGVAKAEVVTIGDGTSTTYVTPFNSLWGYSFVEQIFTADEIGTAGTINAISFNMSSTDSQTNQVDVFMKAVTRSSFSGTTDYEAVTANDMVFSGTVTFNNGWTTITLDTPFEYDGTSNLLIGMHEYTSGYSTRYFYYTSATDKVITFHSDGANPNPYDLGSYTGNKYVSPNRANVQLDITAGGSGSMEDQLHVKYMAGEEEVIDSLNLGTRPINAWMEPFEFTMYTDGPTYTVTHLDFTPVNGMFVVEGEELPFQVVRNDDVDLTIATNGTEAGLIERQFVAITEGDRAAHVWPIVVEMYDPAIPDVWEKACTEATTFPFVEVPARAHNTTLHNDYDLPFDEIEEGYDAVYKLEFANDMVLNAEVTQGENGKVALYTEDFYGEGGPMATNNYNGPMAAGGSAAAPFEAQIGEGTSTTGYFPFYTLYNYTISENLFLATELAEAGVTTAPMTSLSWYATNAPGYAQQGITIWMANVEDAALTTTSHIVTNMTKVYTGAMTPAIGWNEFVFNEGTFSWDGHSNVLIFCQRNNGAWNSTVNWQATTSLPFNAMAYRYQDSGAYDPTVANTMYTSTTRPNIILKSARGSRADRELITIGEGTATTNVYPTQATYNYCFNEMIYPAASIGTAGTISSIGFHFNGANVLSRNVVVYMKNVTRSSFASTTDWEAVTASDIVYTGTLSSDAVDQWVTLTLDAPFYYDGTSNLMIAFDDNTTTWATRYWYYTTGSDNCCMTRYYDGGDIDPYNPGTASGRHNTLPNLQLDITPGGAPTPSTEISYGPVITDAPVAAGTYYLVASSTDEDFKVTINAQAMPCPTVDGFAFNPMPADNEDEIEPASVTLQWMNPANATEYQVVFGSTYHPEANHPQTVISDWTPVTGPTGSFTVRNLWNNTNYFWHVVFRNNGACTEGVSSPIWGFTTHLNIPENLRANDETIFNDETVTLTWNAVQDRTFRTYFIYRDGVKIDQTTTNNIGEVTYTDGPLAYNMDGYTYYVTAIYDEGESAPSNTVNVKVSGRGNVNGHVYEMDGTTGIAGATVTMVGQDEFGVSHTYNFQTNAQGYYSGAVYAGSYNGSAACNGYQTIDAPVQGNPIAITYNVTTSPVDYVLDENFDAPCTVIAEYYPDSLDPHSPYVKVYWGCGLPGEEIIEDFETGDFSMFDWQVDGSYPWSITTNNPYEGTYCMQSGGAGVANVTSNMTVTVEIPADGIMSFFGKISCEQNWDFGYFFIDGQQMGSYTGASSWGEKKFDIAAGTHTFQWRYTKDGSVNSNDDRFYVDYISFYKRPEPAQPGWHTYCESEFNNAVGSNVGTSRWAYEYPTSLCAQYAGFTLTKVSLFSDNMYSAVGGNYTCVIYAGGNEPMAGTAVSTITVDVPQNLNAWVDFDLTTPVQVTGNEPLWVVWTANTHLSNWPAGCCDGLVDQGTWWSAGLEAGYGWEHQTYGTWTMRQYFNNREGRGFYSYASDNAHMPAIDVPVVAKGASVMPVKGQEVVTATCANPNAVAGARIATSNARVLDHYNIYRTNCYNDGPYTEENTVLLSTSWPYDTVYIDVEWADLPAGVYKWGVGAVYVGNRGEMIESPITWAAPQAVNRSANFAAANGTAAGNHTGNGGVENRDGWLVYDDGINVDAIGLTAGGSFYWGVMFPAGSYTGSQLTKVSMYDYSAHNGEILIYQGGDNAPGTLVGQQDYTCTGSEDFVEWTMSTPVAIDPAQNLWIVMHNSNGQYVASIADYCGDDNSQWISLDGSSWDGLYSTTGGAIDGTWMIRAYVEDGGSTPGGSGLNQLAEERESETIWSNCLDKDMYLDANAVTVNVLLNSADSPEGVNVTFTNYNEAEQEMYPIAPIVLDETGFYAFDEFRKGNYNVKVEFEGYEPIEDSVSIWEPTELRYVMTEIIYGVNNLYVSSTGWAMWDPQGAAPGPQPGPGGDDSFTEGFEGGLNGWTVIDAAGSEATWLHSDNNPGGYDYTTLAHGGTGFAMGYSFVDYVGAYNIDSYLVTPQKYAITANSRLSFWADNANDSYPEGFSVCVATVDNPTANDFTAVWSGNAKANGGAKANVRRSDDNRYENWRSHTVDLSAYAGQNVYIAFHDVNYDAYEIWIDDVELSAGRESNDRHLEYFKVMCESLDHEPIFNADVPAEQPFCQVNVDELVEGEHYLCKVAAVYSTGMSAWVECEWQYIPCENYAGTVNGITVEGTTVSWEYPGVGPGPQPGQGSTFSENFDAGMPAGWTTIDANNDNYDWVLGSQVGGIYLISGASLAGSGHNASADLICSGSYSNATNQAITPDNYLVSPQVTLVNGSTFSFWACAQDAGYPAEHFGVFISDNGTSNWTEVQSWTMTAKNGGNVMSIGRDGATRAQGNWYQKTVDLSNFAGQKYIAIRHFGCNDQFILDVDDIELTAGAKNERAAWDLMMTFSAPEGGHYGVAYDGTNFYTSNWGYSSAAYNFYKYDLTGNMIEGFNISGCGTLRGITYDGQYFYGVANSNTVYCVDLANHSVVSTFTSSYGAMRGITYDPVRDGFWVIGNWSGNLTLIDRTGAVQQVGPAPESASDLAYYKDENDVEHIYCFNNGTNDVNDWVIGNGSMGSSVFNFSNVPGFDGGTSGGCTVGSFNGKIAFIGDIQQSPNLIGIYELRDDTNPGPTPTPGDGNVLGAMLFLNGEWEAFVPYPTAEYTYAEGGEYCVRMVYDGTNTLPEGNIYFSMSCPECEGDVPGPDPECEPGSPIYAEDMPSTDQVKIWWGELPPEPISEWLYYDDGTYATSVGVNNASAPIYWATMFPAASLAPYAGTSLTKAAVFTIASSYNNPMTVTIHLGGTTAPGTAYSTTTFTPSVEADFEEVNLDPVAIDGTQNLWIVVSQAGTYPAQACVDTGDPNNRWVSIDGNTWQDLANAGLPGYGWLLRGFVTNQAKGVVNTPIEVSYEGGANGTLSHTEVVSEPAPMAFMNRANMVQYNVYRSTEATGTYEMIGSVPYVDGQTYYEYIDTPDAVGTYYYQVRAEYDNDCESEPAVSGADPTVNYVTGHMTGIVENGDNVALYPNPTNGNVTIEAAGMSRITVVSVLGQVVYDVELTADTYTMNMGQFNAGMYMVRVYTESGVTVKRVTVMQ